MNRLVSIFVILFVPLFMVISAITALLATVAYTNMYDQMQAGMEPWAFSFVVFIIQSIPIWMILNTGLIILLWVGFESKKLRKTKSEKGLS